MAHQLFRKTMCHSMLNNVVITTFPNLSFISQETRVRLRSIMTNVKIGTHDGTFHCDEALACYMLKLLPRFEAATIVRSRQNDVLDKCDIVVDVGGVYDPSKHRYDHHMRTFNETASTVLKKPGYNSTIKLSSAGLIFCHFGHEIIRNLVKKDLTDDDIDTVFKRVYDTIMKEVDAIDNGILMCDCAPRYNIVTGLSSRVGRLNDLANGDSSGDEQFVKAMSIAGEEFLHHVHHTTDTWLPFKKIVIEAVANRFKWDESGEIIVLDQYGTWSHLFDVEQEQNIQPLVKYIIWEDGSSYRIRAVPIAANSFALRKPLLERWRGLKDKELEEVSGIEGAIFVHSVGFIGAHKTLTGAIEMAKLSLKAEDITDSKK